MNSTQARPILLDGAITEHTGTDGRVTRTRYGHPYYSAADVDAAVQRGDEYSAAWYVAQNHLARLCAEEWVLAGYPGIRTVDGRLNPNRNNRFCPSPTVNVLIEMLSHEDVTREHVLGFIHAPETYAFDPAWRMRHSTGRA